MEHTLTPDQIQEIMRCAQDPWHFIRNHVQTQHPVKGNLLFPQYDFLKRLVATIHTSNRLLIPKSRQMLVTWTAVSYFLWRALFRDAGIFLFISRSERCAEELLHRALFILNHLPPFLKPRLLARSREEIAFEGLDSRIFSLPATPDAPRMHSPSGVFWDEMAFTPFDDQIWDSLKPSLDSGAKFLGVSSSNGPAGLFYDLLTTDLGQDFVKHQVHYKEHPDRDDLWESHARLGLSAAVWAREMEISFDAPSQIVFDEFDPEIHVLKTNPVPDPSKPLYRALDFGYHNPFALWIQEITPRNILVFDEIAPSNITASQLALAILEKDREHHLDELNFHWTACDPAGANPTDADISPAQTLQRHGIKLRFRASHINAGIEIVKALLKDATGEIHIQIAPRCVNLINHFALYRWDPKKQTPVKDSIADHSMDALRYFAINHQGMIAYQSPKVAGAPPT